MELLDEVDLPPTLNVVSERNLHSDRYMERVTQDIPGFLKKYFDFPNAAFPEVPIYSPLLKREIGHVPHVTYALQRMLAGGQLIFRWFTDGAKSKTGTFFFPILSLASGPDEAHILCCDNFDDSKRRVQQLERELEYPFNPDLLVDFPWLAKPKRNMRGSSPTWSTREFTISGRSTNRPDPSMYAASTTAGDVRQRRGKFIGDDVEGKDSRIRASVRKELYDFAKMDAIRCWEDLAESARPLRCWMGTPFDVDSLYIKLPNEDPDYEVITVPAYRWDYERFSGFPAKPDGTHTNQSDSWEVRARLLDDRAFTWPRKRMKITKQDPKFGKGMNKLQFHLAYLLDPTGGDPTRLSSEQLSKLVEEATFKDEGQWITVVSLDPASGEGGDYCGISVVRIRWPKDDKMPEVQLLEAHRHDGGLFEHSNFAADLCWKYPEAEEGQNKGRPCRLVFESNSQQGGVYKNWFRNVRPEIRLVPFYTSEGAKFDTEMGLTVIRTLVNQHRLGVPESQITSEGMETFLTEVRDLGSDREHDHIAASVWFVVAWLWKQVKTIRPSDPFQDTRRFASRRPGFFHPRVRMGAVRWRN